MKTLIIATFMAALTATSAMAQSTRPNQGYKAPTQNLQNVPTGYEVPGCTYYRRDHNGAVKQECDPLKISNILDGMVNPGSPFAKGGSGGAVGGSTD